MRNHRQTKDLSIGDLVALAYDTAEEFTSDPELKTLLATLAVKGLLSERRGLRTVTALRNAA